MWHFTSTNTLYIQQSTVQYLLGLTANHFIHFTLSDTIRCSTTELSTESATTLRYMELTHSNFPLSPRSLAASAALPQSPHFTYKSTLALGSQRATNLAASLGWGGVSDSRCVWPSATKPLKEYINSQRKVRNLLAISWILQTLPIHPNLYYEQEL